MEIFNSRGIFVVLGAFLIHLTLGSFFGFGSIQPKIIDFMVNNSLTEPEVIRKHSVWIIGMAVFGMGTSLSLGQYFEQKIGPSMTVLIGGWIMSINVCLMYVTLQSYLTIVIITYGLLSGIGMGLAYGVTLGTVLKWYPKNKGLVLGIVLSGYGISAPMFEKLQCVLIETFDSYSNNLQMSFVILGSIFGGIQFFGSMLLKKSRREEFDDLDIVSVSVGAEKNGNLFLRNSSYINNEVEIELPPHRIIFELDFWVLWLIMFINSFWTYLLTTLYIKYGTILEIKSGLQMIPIISGIFNSIGRLFWGVLIDFKPFKILMLIITLCSALFIGSLIAIRYIPNIYVYTVWISILYFFNSGNFVIFPTMCAKLFGVKDFVFNYGMMFTAFSVAGTVVSIVLMSILPDPGNLFIVFRNLFIISSAITFFAGILTLLFRGKSLITYKY